MKKAILLFLFLFIFIFKNFSQAEKYNLASKKLHKKVRKTIQHYYLYDKESGGFVKKAVNIYRYNSDGNLIETYYLYNSIYSDAKATKKMYNYNSKGLLINTKNVSDHFDKYSSEYKFTYDKKGSLTKKESIYNNGDTSYTTYVNDKKGREISNKSYNKKGKLTSESNTTYNGNKKINIYTGYSSKDGSITGNYTTNYRNNLRTKYLSNGKYSNSKTSYTYDKNDNIIKSVNIGKKKTSETNYDYVYDKKNNWVKKHYRSGKYQYFYFREIYFENGDVTGSSNFDKQFINRLGNFDNVEVVALKKKEKKTSKNKNSSYIKNKTWNFDYVYLSDKVKKLVGTIDLKIKDFGNLKRNSNVDFNIKFKSNNFTFSFIVDDYKELEDKYQWTLTNNKKETGVLYVFKKEKVLKDKGSSNDFYVNGLLTIVEKTKSSMSFYLK